MSSDLTVTQAANNTQATVSQRQQLADDFDDFLTLLTTQLQNQDPLSPMDSTEFTNQLVNFAGVEQQINANQKLDALVNFSLTNANIQALSYVGLKANYQSTEAYFDGQSGVDISYVVDGNPVKADIRILDAEGNTVATIPGLTGSGRKDFFWDGLRDNGQPAEVGTYQVRVDAVNDAGTPLNSQILVSGVVVGIETQDGIPMLLIGERAVPIGNVINVSLPTNNNTESDGGEA
jgi:flagellar basal-body rod modification protein FlgD